MTSDPETLRALLARLELPIRRNKPDGYEMLFLVNIGEIALLAAPLCAKIAETDNG